MSFNLSNVGNFFFLDLNSKGLHLRVKREVGKVEVVEGIRFLASSTD